MSKAEATAATDGAFVPADAQCIECRYALVGLDGDTCPECGRRFNPANEATYLRRDLKERWQRAAKAPSTLECAVYAAIALTGVVGASGPAQWVCSPMMLFCTVLFLPWLGISALFCYRVVAAWRLRMRMGRVEQARKQRVRWLIIPVCFVLLASTLVWAWPVMVRFKLSEGAFNQAVADYQAGVFRTPCRVGLYTVSHVTTGWQSTPGRPVISFVVGESIADPVGFDYDPLPNHKPGFKEVNVGRGWYTAEY